MESQVMLQPSTIVRENLGERVIKPWHLRMASWMGQSPIHQKTPPPQQLGMMWMLRTLKSMLEIFRSCQRTFHWINYKREKLTKTWHLISYKSINWILLCSNLKAKSETMSTLTCIYLSATILLTHNLWWYFFAGSTSERKKKIFEKFCWIHRLLEVAPLDLHLSVHRPVRPGGGLIDSWKKLESCINPGVLKSSLFWVTWALLFRSSD